jgi:hypothetical protein
MPSLHEAPARSTNYWSGIAGIVGIQLAVLLAVCVAALVYINWSSSAAMAEFMATGKAPASKSNDLRNFSAPIQHANGRGACARRT